MNVSFCMTGLDAAISSLSLIGNVEQEESDLIWNINTPSIDTDPLQSLLGADLSNKTLSQRGVLQIADSPQEAAPPALFSVNDKLAQEAIESSITGVFGLSVQGFEADVDGL